MSEMIRTGDSPVDVGIRVGRRRKLGADASNDPVGELVDQMGRNGFAPSLRQAGSAVEITLQTCPFASTALADPDTVCALHLGIARGVADQTGGRLVVDDLTPHDPRRAGCRLRAHLVEAR